MFLVVSHCLFADIIIEEGHQNYGVTAELAARIAEKAYYYLDAPIQRMGAMDVPVPFSPVLENLYIPSPEKIIKSVQKILSN